MGLGTHTGSNETLKDMANVADNIQTMLYFNVTLPDWIEHPTTIAGYSKQTMLQEVLSFTDSFLSFLHIYNLCAENEECRLTVGGFWLNEIEEVLKKKAKRSKPDYRMILYSSHGDSVLCLMKLMKLNVSSILSATGFLIEFRDEPFASLRVFHHEPDTNDNTLRVVRPLTMPYFSHNSWCPLDTFLSNVASWTISDWRQHCNMTSC